MAMKYCENVADYFRLIIDENDATFIDDATVSKFLEIGYDEFVQAVSDIDPNFYIATQTYTLAGVTELDLATAVPTIMGPTVAAPARQVSQILRIVQLDTSGVPTNIYTPVYSYEQLITPGTLYPARFMLQGTLLKFSGQINATIRIEYIPLSNVDWTQINVGDNEYIDEMLAFHDLIALFAAKHYFMMDTADNTSTLRQIQKRLQDVNDFVERGRLRNANRFVTAEDPYLVDP